jgi:HD-like signal output (HDOD) protein
MKRILFVDDEDRVLQGLGRMLRPMRTEWAMEFARGGEEALALLAQAPADVLVTDMRMPGMDGAELLARVRERFPNTVRIILTGQASREAILHGVRVAHRQLAKPCDAEVLKRTVSQACALRDRLPDDRLAAEISRVESVPSLPALYRELDSELRSAQPSLPRVDAVIRRDLGMVVNLLKMANSPLFGFQGPGTSLVRASSLLGLENIQDLMSAARVFSVPEPETLSPPFLDRLWAHSQATGALARAVAEQEHAAEEVVEESALAGLLHDVGKLLLGIIRPGAYEEVLSRAGPRPPDDQEAERAAFHTTHAEVGGYFLGLWGLPEAVVEAVAGHHQPGGWSSGSFRPLTAVHVANVLVREELSAGEDLGDYLDRGYLEQLGLTGRLPAWRKCWQELRATSQS